MCEEKKIITDFKKLVLLLKNKNICKRAVVVWPEENHTQEAVCKAVQEGFIKPVLVSSEQTKKEFADKVKQEFSTAKVKEDEFVTSGFIIEENGIQENYTFEVKLDFMRDELEVEISKLLFS